MQQGKETQATIQEMCGDNHQLLNKTESLLRVLQRLQHVLTQNIPSSTQDRHAREKESTSVVDSCKKSLGRCHSYLLKIKDLHEDESGVLRSSGPVAFSERQQNVLDQFLTEFVDHAHRLSAHTVKVSATFLDQIQDELDAVSGEAHALRFAVARITSRLLVYHDLEFFHDANDLDDEVKLWNTLKARLVTEGFSGDFLKRRKFAITNYVKALERNSVPHDTENAQPRSGHRRESMFSAYKSDENNPLKSPSRKRTRSIGDDSDQRGSTETRFIKYGKPDQIFGGTAVDDTILADSIKEDSSLFE